MKGLLVFILAAALSVAAAWYRHGDSAHAMGMVSVKGGRALHPVHLPCGKDRYTLVVTGTILPPYRGDARVVVEGEPTLHYSVYGSDPIVDLGLRRRPTFNEQTLTDLRPGDRFTVWVVLQPPGSMTARTYSLTFYDTVTDTSVLQIPVFFGGGEDHQLED